jgi:hypothetical protein
MLVVWGWRLFSGRCSRVYSRITVYVLVLGFGAIILIGLGEHGALSLDWGAGRLGGWLAARLGLGLGPVGAYIAVTVALLAAAFRADNPQRTVAHSGKGAE